MPRTDPDGTQRSSLKWWFWGTIFAMAGVTIGLSMLAWQQAKRGPIPASTSGSTPALTAISESKPINGAELHAKLSKDASQRLNRVSFELSEGINAAYAPVYAAVPIYADHHYSLWGQYAELAVAASGKLEEMLIDRLFKGHDARMAELSALLQQSLNDAFIEAFDAATKELGPPEGLSTASQIALNDVRSRIRVTIPVGATATLSAGLAAKALATKIAAKAAGMAAAKTGGKWAAAGTGAGVSAAACSWSGPGAALCAVVGGVGVWVIADMGVLKLDEIWGRDQFEKDLRTLIDEQKTEHTRALQDALIGQAVQQDQAVTDTIKNNKNNDFSPSDLKKIEGNRVCAASDGLRDGYSRMRMSLAARDLDSVADLLRLSALHAGVTRLAPLRAEIETALASAGTVELGVLRIAGTLPDSSKAESDISGVLRIGAQEFPFDRVSSTENGSFRVELLQAIEFDLHKGIDVRLDLEQHRWLRNRFFSGAGTLPIAGSGTGMMMELRMPIMISEVIKNAADSRPGFAPGEVEFSGQLRGLHLAPLSTPPECP